MKLVLLFSFCIAWIIFMLIRNRKPPFKSHALSKYRVGSSWSIFRDIIYADAWRQHGDRHWFYRAGKVVGNYPSHYKVTLI